jgi:subtilase family serine protease
MKTIRLWAGIACVLCTIACFAQVTQQVTALQYFYDTDPGVGVAGNGAVMAVTPTADLDQTYSFPLPGSFTNGFHQLYVRVKDENGRWSIAERRTFYVTDITAGTRNITAYQYYFDSDPGVGLPGNGAVVPIVSTANYTATLTFSLPALSNGFHQLFFRTKDDLGHWSIAERRMFYVSDLTLGTRNMIAYQYYFDSDPGVGIAGNGAVVPITSTADYTASLTLSVPVLSNGFHQLFLRTKDDLGRWSIAERRMFYVSDIITGTRNIVAYQYYFDSDPGVGVSGNGAVVPITSTSDYTASLSFSVPTLSNGFHQLFLRTKDDLGRWSIADRRMFYVSDIVAGTRNIMAYQYYVDSDPGVGVPGNGAVVPVTSTADFNSTVAITLPALNSGLHQLFLRTKDVLGRWSLAERRLFYINSGQNTSQTVTALEFYYDTDPGVGNGNSISVTASADINSNFSIGVPCLSTGTHYLYLRAKNEFGKWSIIERDTLQVTSGMTAAVVTPAGPVGLCLPNSVTFSALFIPGVSYQWLLEGNAIPGATSNTYVATAAGHYSLKSTCGSSFVTSNVVTVSIVSELTYYADTDNDGYGNAVVTTMACTPPAGFVANDDDCNDGNVNIHPGATEICNGFDDDCDGAIDEESVVPVISNCPADNTMESETGQWGAHVTWIAPTATDICGMQSFTSSHSSGDFFNVGSTLVTYTALDIHGNTSTCTFNVNVSPPEILGDINLSVFANDIQFSNSNPPPGTFISVSVTVHNNSNEDASSFVCHLVNQYDNTSYPDVTVPALGANQSTIVNWIIQTPALPAFVPMQVTIDYLNGVVESNELDNQAVRPFINGILPFGGRIVVVASAIPYSSVAGSGISICGNAYYDDTAVPLDDPSVAGAQVTVTITETGQVINGVTNANGDFCVPYYTPNTAGLYHFIAEVTDFTLTGDTTGTFLLVPPPVDYCPKDLAVSMELFGSFLCGNVYNILQGTSLTGIVHVSNSCKAVSQSTILYIALPDGTPVPGPFTIPALAPGQTYNVSLPAMTFNTLGATYISATVDFFNDVVEDNETNNSRSITIQVHPPLPDIVPTNGHVSSDYQCTPAVVSFRIENHGGAPTGNFNTILEIYHGPTLETTLTQTVGNIPGLCNTDIAFTFNPLYSGTYHFHLTCDTLPNGVTELVELNNHLSFSHYFNPCNLDLFVYECGFMDVKPANPVFPGTITVFATIANVGQLPVATPFVVEFDVAGTTYPVTVNSPIPANGTKVVSVAVPTPPFGDNDLTVIADANGSVAELNETNNISTAKLCWDFEPVNFKCNGAPPFRTTQFICNPIDLSIGVLNHGLYEATNLQVKFEVNGPGLGGWTNLGYVTTFMDNTCGCPLIVGMPSSFLFPQVGNYQVRITADFANLYNECFENNNQIILPVSVVENADYAVYSQFIAPSKLNPDVNEAITFNLTYKNEGCTGLSPIELYMQMDNTPHDSVNAVALASNAMNTYAIPHSWSSPLPGVHVIRSIIDHNHVIAEGNELNNEATRAVIVGGAPNFNLFELASSSMSPSYGQTITLTASVTNEGATHADGWLQFYFVNAQDEEVLISQQLIHLAEDETVEATTAWFVTYPPARLIARVSNVEPLEYNFNDNERDLQLNNLVVVSTSTDVPCADLTLGKLKAIVTGGQAPYFIQWSNGFTGDSINVPSGTYSVLVTDFNGLTAIAFDTIMDLAFPVTWYKDLDNDGFGNPAVTQIACSQSSGFVGTGTDCNDSNPLIYPDAPELADGKDNDCDGLIDEGISVLNVEVGDCEVVYFGYTPSQCQTLLVSASGGMTPYTYLWSNGATTQTVSVCPTATTIYTVTVTDHNGYTAKDKITVQVIDIRCGNNNNKVVVCHLPPGNPENLQIICVAPSAVPAHLAHGDYLGICEAVDPCDQEEQSSNIFYPNENITDENLIDMQTQIMTDQVTGGEITIFPNPANSFVEIHLPETATPYEVMLYDVSGKLLQRQSMESGRQRLSTEELVNGIYLIQIRSSGERMTTTIVVMH